MEAGSSAGCTVAGPGDRGAAQVPASRERGFWVVTCTLGLFLFAASAPSPLYRVYASSWHFSPTTLTEIFAVYAVALLITLLTAGSLSDAVGRRPVIVLGLAVQSLAMVGFLVANGAAWLFAARITQGVATGLVTAAVAAALIDLQPENPPGRGALVNAITPAFGLALGALVSGALVQYGPAPTRLIYALLLGGFVILAGTLAMVPETVTGRHRPSFSVRLGVDRSVRPRFVSALPCLIATWALGGLYLSLGPSIIEGLAGSTNRFLGGTVVTLLAGAGGTASWVARNWPPRRAMLIGCAALTTGVTVSVIGVASGEAAIFYVGTGIAGIGFGTAFLGAFRVLVSVASAESRAALVASIYVVAYLAFSVPAVIAGLSTTHFGLKDTSIAYGAVIAALSLAAIPAMSLMDRRLPDTDPQR